MSRSLISIASVSSALVKTALALAVATSGCQALTEGWRGKGYDDQINSLTENLRPPADEKQMTGLDAKARDIERNLGVR